MLMTQEFTPKARDIMAVLRGADDWLDRNEIASLLGKNRLNPHEVKILDGLVDSGQVSRDTQDVAISSKFVYQIIT